MVNKDKKTLSEIGKKTGAKGGRTTLKRYGKKHFVKAVKVRWDRVRAEKAKLKEGFSKT